MADRETQVAPADYDGRFGKKFDDEIQVGPVVYSAVGITVITVLGMLITWWMLQFFETRSDAAAPPPSPVAEANERQLPTGPLLQAHPEEELTEMRREMAARLNGYGWVDESRGIVHIPIERTFDLMLVEGFARVDEIRGDDAAASATGVLLEPAAGATTQ